MCIERRGRFVEHDHRLDHQGAGKRDALALTAGKGAGQAGRRILGKADAGKDGETRLSRSAGDRRGSSRPSGSATIRPTRQRGSRLAPGSWNTACTLRRRPRKSAPRALCKS
jgi:hypothetical protein